MADEIAADTFAAVVLPQLERNVVYFRSLVEDLTDEEFATQPGGTNVNTPWWIVGHVTLTLGGAIKMCGGDSPLPASFASFFSGGTDPLPLNESDEVLDKKALMGSFDAAVEELTRALRTADAATLAAPRDTSFAPELRLVRDMVTFLATSHFAVHSGQLTAWRRLSGRNPRF